MSLRVTLGTYDAEPPVGGQGVMVRGLRAALTRRGIAVHTVAGVGEGALTPPRLTRRPPLDLSIQLTRRPQLLLGGAPDVVHLMGGPGGVTVPRRLPVPVVYTATHTYRQAYSRRSPRRLLSLAEAAAYRRAARVLAISPSTAEAVAGLGVARWRIEVVPPGVETGRIAAVAARVERDPTRLLFVGRLEPVKGPLAAVALMARLAAEGRGVSGLVLGEGSLDGRVRAAVEASGAPISVLGRVDDERLAFELGRAAVVVQPSAYEGLGLVALEALSAGTPVAGYDVTGLRDAIGEADVLAPAGDLVALTGVVRRLLGDPEWAAELAARGRERVLREHSWDAFAARVETIYESVLAG